MPIPTPAQYQPPPWWQSLIAGGIAGTIEISVTYPTELIKTKLQLPTTNHHHHAPPPPTTPFQYIKHTLQTQGIKGMYVGLVPMMIGNGTKSATRFLTFDTTRNYLQAQDLVPKQYIPFASGIIAGLIEAVLIVTPTESIKTRRIAVMSSSSTHHHIQNNIQFSKFEFLHLWRGCVPVMLRQSFNSGIRFSSYTYLKTNLNPTNTGSEMTFVRGALVGLITVYCTMPFDTIKTRMQNPLLPTKSATLGHAFLSIWNEGGVYAFWKGSTPRLSRLVFSGAIVFTVYEHVMLGFQRL